jgi:hypothetical protein
MITGRDDMLSLVPGLHPPVGAMLWLSALTLIHGWEFNLIV